MSLSNQHKLNIFFRSIMLVEKERIKLLKFRRNEILYCNLKVWYSYDCKPDRATKAILKLASDSFHYFVHELLL